MLPPLSNNLPLHIRPYTRHSTAVFRKQGKRGKCPIVQKILENSVRIYGNSSCDNDDWSVRTGLSEKKTQQLSLSVKLARVFENI